MRTILFSHPYDHAKAARAEHAARIAERQLATPLTLQSGNVREAPTDTRWDADARHCDGTRSCYAKNRDKARRSNRRLRTLNT